MSDDPSTFWAPLNEDENHELYDRIEKKFGPRPTDPDELARWKMGRYTYVYGIGRVMLDRLRKEQAP